MSGWTSEPRNLIEQAADNAFDAIRDTLADAGATAVRMLVLIDADGIDTSDGSKDSVTAASGNEVLTGRDVLAMLIEHAVESGKELGVDVMVAPMGRG